MPKFTLTINGQTVIRDKLTKYERDLRKFTRKGVNKASSMVSKEAKSLWRQRSGLLKKAQGFVVKTFPTGKVIGIIGPRRGYRTTITGIKGNKVSGVRMMGGTKAKKVSLKGGKVMAAYVAYRRAKGKEPVIDPTLYAHLVEGGHAKGAGKSAAKPYPALSIAYRRNLDAAKAMIADAVKELKP